jgi:transposase-like protein
MRKRGPNYSREERLAILKEGEKSGANAVYAKYGMNDQTYRVWRYQAAGIQPRKQFSEEEKRQIFEEGYQKRNRAGIAPPTGSVPEPIMGEESRLYQIASALLQLKKSNSSSLMMSSEMEFAKRPGSIK